MFQRPNIYRLTGVADGRPPAPRAPCCPGGVLLVPVSRRSSVFVFSFVCLGSGLPRSFLYTENENVFF